MIERLEDLFKTNNSLVKETDIDDFDESDKTKPLNNTMLVNKVIKASDIVRMWGDDVGDKGILFEGGIEKKDLKNLSESGNRFLESSDNGYLNLNLIFERTAEGVVEISLCNANKRIIYSVHKSRKIHCGNFQKYIDGSWVNIDGIQEPKLEDLVVIANVGRDKVLSNCRSNSA